MFAWVMIVGHKIKEHLIYVHVHQFGLYNVSRKEQVVVSKACDCLCKMQFHIACIGNELPEASCNPSHIGLFQIH